MRKIIILFLLIFGTISCNTNKVNTLFELLSNSKTNINFQNNLNYTEELNPYTYRNFYNGGGVGVGDFNNDSLQDIFFTGNLVSNKLYLNRGIFIFEDIKLVFGISSESINTIRSPCEAFINSDLALPGDTL